jgi:IS30 family transposase
LYLDGQWTMLTVDQNQCEIAMPETYAHLNEKQRYQIYEGLIGKLSHRQIAQKIRKHHSSVSREINRNQGLKGYRPRQAQSFSMQRKEEKQKHIKLTLKVQAVIKKNIGKEWSPEQIQGRLIFEGHEMVFATTIYHYIQQDKAEGGWLYKSLQYKKSGRFNLEVHNHLDCNYSHMIFLEYIRFNELSSCVGTATD